jgi:UDP-GlcNAc:undecaprenyl-phosphate GlcNAc-1-phosphate transferase
MTFLLCTAAVIIVNLRNEEAGLFLILLGGASIIFVRKLGYFGHIEPDRVSGWFKDVTDQAGITNESRRFNHLQMDIGRSKTPEELWMVSCSVLERLEFDMAEMKLHSPGDRKESKTPAPLMKWSRGTFDCGVNENDVCLLKMELPLVGRDGTQMGMLRIVKDLKRDGIGHFTLRRVEHLRRTLIDTLKKIEDAR